MLVTNSMLLRSGASLMALMFVSAAYAEAPEKAAPVTAWEASRKVDDNATVSTGVAKARDPLNSATSTSAYKERDFSILAPMSLADIMRNVPGIRAEAGTGVANNSYTVRGLPLVNAGAKYLQLQEDGLPVLEFGDFFVAPSDVFLRPDVNVAQIESIRGGSSSTFASNAPGGVVNLVSKTGEVEGGSIEASSGIGYDVQRLDADYGGQLGGGWRFHIGGFYRQGEGPRSTGYNALEGGQVKLNITRQFSNGYIRLNAKLLDDRFPYYYIYPVAVTGTNEDPHFQSIANFDINKDTPSSPYITSRVAPGANGAIRNDNLHDDMHTQSKSLGFEAQFSLQDWTLTDRFRYADNSGVLNQIVPLAAGNADDIAAFISRQSGNTLTYATGPLKGSQINPATVNGNGLLMLSGLYQARINSMRNVTNDFRASRTWKLGDAALTTTFGVYKALQDLDTGEGMTTVVQDVVGGGRSALVDIRSPGGTLVTQNGVANYGFIFQPGVARNADMRYDVTAPYGSFNVQKGRFALGGSLRFDFGKVRGIAFADQGTRGQDIDGNGVIDLNGPEAFVPVIDPGTQWPVNYNYDYVSYSVGLNYRVADALSVFARLSRGARAGADALIFSPAIDHATGGLTDPKAAYDPVRQVEGGFKYRSGGVIVNVTAFLANTRETNSQILNDSNGNQIFAVVQRTYRTYGVELESRVHKGPFTVNGTLTLSGGKITAANDPTVVNNKPRHQAEAIYSLTPQYENDLLTVGVNIAGQTSSYSQDANQLKMPGYTTVGAFVQIRPVERLSLGLNVSNLFNVTALVDADAAVPTTGANVLLARTLPGRLVTASARFFF